MREHYHRLRSRNLPTELLDSLLAIFESWIYLHLKTHNRKALAMFLNIPTGDIAETVAGRELIEEGIERSLFKLGRKHFGPVETALMERIKSLDLEKTEQLFDAMLDMGSWDDVTAWMDKQG